VDTTSGATDGLSAASKLILERLDVPVELQFFAPANATFLPDSLQSYVARVSALMDAYESEGQGNVRVTRRDPEQDRGAKAAAAAAGILPASTSQGDIYYLGITVSGKNRVETVARLSPDWEPALEADLSRAIARVSTSSATITAATPVSSAPTAPIDTALSEELLRTIPDLESRSFDEAAQILRESALSEFKAASAEMQERVRVAQQELAEARAGGSAAEQENAMKNLLQIQAQQSDKLKAITAQLQQRISVLERLKGVPSPSVAR